MAAAVAAGAAERLLRRDYDWRTATPASRLCSMALERAAPERRRQKRRARRAVEVHPTAEWLRAAAEEASATPPPHQEQRGRPGSARELADFEANLARVRPPAGPSSVEAHNTIRINTTIQYNTYNTLYSSVSLVVRNPALCSVLLPAPSPALPAAMADDPSMRGRLATARATQLVDIVR